MTGFDWSPLRSAMADCRRAGVTVPLWWRDDDAVAPTPDLDQLSDLAVDLGMRVHLAIIPARAERALVPYCADAPLVPVVHGWAHADHGAGADKKNEFLTPRAGRSAEARQGLERLRGLFGSALRPMFVPPWNRIGADLIPALGDMGYSHLSTFGPRHAANAAPGLVQVNTHVDPIWWKGTRDLVDADTLIEGVAAHLRARATGEVDADEPLGLLTHHLVHSLAIWSFVRGFVTEMQMAGAEPWSMENDDEPT